MTQPAEQRLSFRANIKLLRSRVDHAVERFVAVLMALLVLNVLWQVVTRFVLNRPSAFTEEVARYGLIWLGIWGATLAFSRGLHPSLMEAVTTVFGGPPARRILTRIAPAAVALFALLVLIYGGLRLVFLTQQLGQRSAALNVPLAWVYTVVPIGGLLILFYAVCDLVASSDGKSAPSPTAEDAS